MTPDNVLDTLSDLISNLNDQCKDKIKDSENLNNIFILDNVKKLVNYTACNFSGISIEKLKKLDNFVIEEIISNDSLQVMSEDELLGFVIEKYKEDPSNNSLFEYGEFQNVNEETIEKFIKQFSISDLNQAI